MYRFLLFFLLVSTTLAAQANDAKIAAFNKAWLDYSAAMETEDSQRKVDSAALTVASAKEIFNESDEQLTVVTHNYGVALSDNGDREQAIPVLEDAVKLGEIVYGKSGEGLIPILADLADATARPFSEKTQLRHYKRALKIAKSSFGKESVEYADVAFRAARNVYSYSRYNGVSNYMKEARDIYASQASPKLQNVALANFYLGKMEFTRKNYSKSIDYLERGLTGFEGGGEANQALRLLTRGLLVQTYEAKGLRDEATQHCIAIGRENQLSPEQDFMPLVRVAPVYPSSMLRAGKSGYVDIQFTVDEYGFVREPVVVSRNVNGREKSRASDFDKAALDAVEKFRYAPRFENGEPVASTGVDTRISFQIER